MKIKINRQYTLFTFKDGTCEIRDSKNLTCFKAETSDQAMDFLCKLLDGE